MGRRNALLCPAVFFFDQNPKIRTGCKLGVRACVPASVWPNLSHPCARETKAECDRQAGEESGRSFAGKRCRLSLACSTGRCVAQLVAMALVSTEAQLCSMSPGPERFMTMNLMSTGPCTVSKGATSYGRTVRRMNTRDNHTTADVDGARTFVRTSTLTNKPDSYGVAVRHVQIEHAKEDELFFVRC